MKIKETSYLANLSIKASKKTNTVLVLLLAVSMIIIIPVFVLWISVNVSIGNKLNSVPYMLYSQVCMKDYRIETTSDEKYLSGSQNIAYFDDINSKIVYENYYLTTTFLTTDISLSIGDDRYVLKNDQNRFFNIIDLEKSSYFFPKNLKSYDSVFVKNCDKSFSDYGKKQVVVSETLLEDLGLSAEDAYEKNMSIYMQNDYRDGYLCYEYQIAGVIKKDVSKIFENTESYMDAVLYFCSPNVYNEAGEGMLKPVMTGNEFDYAYKNIADKNTLNKEYMMLGISGNVFTQDSFSNTKVFIEASDYADLAKINSYLIKKSIEPSNSEMYDNYKKLYDISNIVTFIFATAGIVLILITILYYYLNIKHNVSKRQNFLTIMRAIGAHDSDIPKIYMMQSNILLGKATAIFLIFGFALCVLIKLLIDTILTVNGMAGIITVSWLSIFLSLAGMTAIMFVVANAIALACTARLSKQPIMEILHEEQ